MKTIDQSSLIAYDNAAAGHDGVLSDSEGLLVFKPCTQAEISFYESAIQDHPRFARHMPTFMGTLTQTLSQNKDDNVSEHPTKHSGSVDSLKADDVGPMHGKALNTNLLIAMENVAAGFTKPNILDVKLGARLWDDDASLAKRSRLDSVASKTTSSSLGFRIAGMKLWNRHAKEAVSKEEHLAIKPDERGDMALMEVDSATGYTSYNKLYGRKFSSDDVIEGFLEYCGLNGAEKLHHIVKVQVKEILEYFIGEVETIQEVLEKEESRMYSSSILFIYESDSHAYEKTKAELARATQASDAASEAETDDEAEDRTQPKLAVVRLIDFAHARWVPGDGPDENALLGVRNIHEILRQVRAGLDESTN